MKCILICRQCDGRLESMGDFDEGSGWKGAVSGILPMYTRVPTFDEV